MAQGIGKYDKYLTPATLGTNADAALLIVLGGDLGSGFSVQMLHPRIAEKIPDILREIADKIETDVERMKN